MVSIVILTALGATHLADCLASIAAQRHPPDRCEVIVVDNGSAVDPTTAAERAYPGARVIRNGTNLGFAAGNNVGRRRRDRRLPGVSQRRHARASGLAGRAWPSPPPPRRASAAAFSTGTAS